MPEAAKGEPQTPQCAKPVSRCCARRYFQNSAARALTTRGDCRIDPEADRKFHALVGREGLLVEAEASRLMEVFPYLLRRHVVQRHPCDGPAGLVGGVIESNLFIAKIQPGTAGQTGLLFSTYFGSAGVYVGNGIAVGPDGSVYTGGYGTVGLPSSSNGNGFAGGVSDGFLIVVK